MRPEKIELPLRIIFVAPPLGAAIAMQRGKTDLAPPIVTAEGLAFDFPITVTHGPAGEPRLLGLFVQGPPFGRFVYINSGTYAGDAKSAGGRRAKIPLTSLTWSLIEACKPGQRLEARVQGTAKDGGVACASVPLMAPGWRIVAD